MSDWLICESTGKRCLSKADAKKAQRSERDRSPKDPVHAYLCPDWAHHPKHRYHVGHVDQKHRKRK